SWSQIVFRHHFLPCYLNRDWFIQTQTLGQARACFTNGYDTHCLTQTECRIGRIFFPISIWSLINSLSKVWTISFQQTNDYFIPSFSQQVMKTLWESPI